MKLLYLSTIIGKILKDLGKFPKSFIFINFLSYIPNGKCIGGIITVINNHSNESRYKEWKWFQYEDGAMFNDKDYVIDMLSDFVRQLKV